MSLMGGTPMTASRTRPLFVRRGRPEDRRCEIVVPFTDEEYAIVEAEAAALSLSIENFLLMRALEVGKADGNA
jgi:hypothetical protein